MSEEAARLYTIGQEEELEGCDLDVFVNFFLERFPDEGNTDYAHEWAQRFKKKTEIEAADSHSRLVIIAVRDRGRIKCL